MREILLASLVTLIGGGLVVIGSIATISPSTYVKLHVRAFGGLGVPFWARNWYDPRVLAQSRDLRNQWRLTEKQIKNDDKSNPDDVIEH